MTRSHRTAAVAAVFAIALLASPLHAAKTKPGSLLGSAWDWLVRVVCDDNGYVVP
jgi:hypothetical protein